MRILILSCNTGGGHNACANAICAAFRERGVFCVTADSLSFLSDKLSRFLSWGHTTMYRHIPRLFRAAYGMAENHLTMFQDKAAVYQLLTCGTQQLYAYLQGGKYDAVICTHVFSGLLLRQTKKEYPLQIRTAFVGTDYTCSPGTAISELDYYFIPAASLASDFTAQGVPAEKIFPSGIPVRKDFYEKPNKKTAKEILRIDPSHKHILMMCGSMGCGPLKKMAKLLCEGMDETTELSIVCGTNKKLQQKLTKSFGCVTNIHIHGFVQDMSLVMDSADLYLTKPGGLSTTEAAAKKLPMVFIDIVSGCEAYNRNYFVDLGGAVTANTPEDAAHLCLELMNKKERLAQMKNALEVLPYQNAANYICEIMGSGEKNCTL